MQTYSQHHAARHAGAKRRALGVAALRDGDSVGDEEAEADAGDSDAEADAECDSSAIPLPDCDTKASAGPGFGSLDPAADDDASDADERLDVEDASPDSRSGVLSLPPLVRSPPRFFSVAAFRSMTIDYAL